MSLETEPIRRGEELETSRLSDFLEALGLAGRSKLILEQFPAGSSNLTYLIKAGDGRELVLRRPPVGNTVKSAHDMHREFNVLSKLSSVYPSAPKPLAFCDDLSVVGSEFYLMERRRGLVIRGELDQKLLKDPLFKAFNSSQRYQTDVCRNFIQNLADLHALDYTAAGLADLGRPEGYPRRQVEGWTKRYFNAQTDEWPDLESAIEWLNANIPSESGASLIHNDYKFDNVMLDPNDLTKILAVLDWEMVTIGDPLMDLGTTLGYWIGAEGGDGILNMPFNPRVLRENISRLQLAEMYSEASGRDTSNIAYYYVFGLVKIAGIVQQIYARYVRGITSDERFANFDKFISSLGTIAAGTIDSGHI